MAPDGLLAAKCFAEIFHDLILLNYDNEILPEQWANLTTTQVGIIQDDKTAQVKRCNLNF